MSESQGSLPIPKVERPGPLALVAAGRQAFREVPGLRMLLIKGFVLIYLIFAGLGLAAFTVLYRYLILPLSSELDAYQRDGGMIMDLLVPLLNALLSLAQLMLLAAVLLLSLILAISLMTVWFEALAERIVKHRRGLQDLGGRFSLAGWVRSLLRALRDSLWLFLVSGLSMALGIWSMLFSLGIPIGPAIVFLVNAYLLGWEAREPYLMVREGLGDDRKGLRRGLTLWTMHIGLLPVLLALIPGLGWVLLPVVLVYQVAGMAWANEEGGAPAPVREGG